MAQVNLTHIDALRVQGKIAPKARYPNIADVETLGSRGPLDGFISQAAASYAWIEPDFSNTTAGVDHVSTAADWPGVEWVATNNRPAGTLSAQPARSPLHSCDFTLLFQNCTIHPSLQQHFLLLSMRCDTRCAIVADTAACLCVGVSVCPSVCLSACSYRHNEYMYRMMRVYVKAPLLAHLAFIIKELAVGCATRWLFPPLTGVANTSREGNSMSTAAL